MAEEYKLHNIKFRTGSDKSNWRLEIDGMEIRGVRSIDLWSAVKEYPTVRIEMYAESIEVDFGGAVVDLSLESMTPIEGVPGDGTL